MPVTDTRRPPAAPATVADDAMVLSRLSTLDRFLPLWIGLAMAAGLGLGALIPSLNDGLDKLRVGTVIAADRARAAADDVPGAREGPLRGARPRAARRRLQPRSSSASSLFLSWIVGPLLMFALAWLLLADQPAYRTGVIIVGLARCIAMVLIWNDLAKGDRDRAAILVVFNALFQVAAYSLLGYFYLTVLPGWLGLDTQGFEVGIWEVARTVLIFLGIPLTAGYLTRRIGLKRKGRDWYEQRFIPRISPITLYGLLFTIVLLFAIQGDTITVAAARCRPDRAAAARLLRRHVDRRVHDRASCSGSRTRRPRASHSPSPRNDFELAIAVAVGVFGATSGQALAGVVGPLIEVPVLVSLVYVALWARRFWPSPPTSATAPAQHGAWTL